MTSEDGLNGHEHEDMKGIKAGAKSKAQADAILHEAGVAQHLPSFAMAKLRRLVAEGLEASWNQGVEDTTAVRPMEKVVSSMKKSQT